MKEQLISRLKRTNSLFIDFTKSIDESLFSAKLPNLPSNTIGQQLWCVLGARTSYLKAAKAGSWQGFECHLSQEDIQARDVILKSLDDSYLKLEGFLKENGNLSGEALDYLLDLLEHESQHHGQLIRYLYGLKIEIPESWKARYSLY